MTLGLGYANSKITICRTIFVFSSKTSSFARLGALFFEPFKSIFCLFCFDSGASRYFLRFFITFFSWGKDTKRKRKGKWWIGKKIEEKKGKIRKKKKKKKQRKGNSALRASLSVFQCTPKGDCRAGQKELVLFLRQDL